MKNKSYLSGLKTSNIGQLLTLLLIFISSVSCSENLLNTKLIGGVKPIPDNAIKIDNDLYYVPIGKNENGCIQYKAFSQKQSTMSVILYRDEQGNFVSSSNLINCQKSN